MNVDAIVIMQSPRLAPHRDAMRACLAAALGVDRARVTVRASTTDHLGFAGRGEGAACHAVALLRGGMTAAGVVSFDLDETLWAFMPMMDGVAAARPRRARGAPARAARARSRWSELHDERGRVAEEREGSYQELRLESFRRVLAATA